MFIKLQKNAKILYEFNIMQGCKVFILQHNLKTLKFDPNFFLNISSNNFECKILKQNIEGKISATNRFDVLIEVTK